MPFCFTWCIRLPSEWYLSTEHWQSNPAHEDWMHYCVQVRVTLGEGGGDQRPPSQAWTGLLIADMFQDGLEEWITEAVVLVPVELILFLVNDHSKRVFTLVMQGMLDSAWVAQSIGMGERIRWKWWWVLSRKGCQVITDTVVEKRTEAMGTGCPGGRVKTNWTPAAVYYIEEWMWGLEKDDLKVEVGNGEVSNHETECSNSCSQHVGRSRRWCRRQGTPWLLRETLPVDISLQEEQAQSREVSRVPISWPWLEGLGSSWAGRTGRGLRMGGQSANLQGWKDQGCCDLPFLVVGHSYCVLLWLGQPTLAAVHLPIITGVS